MSAPAQARKSPDFQQNSYKEEARASSRESGGQGRAPGGDQNQRSRSGVAPGGGGGGGGAPAGGAGGARPQSRGSRARGGRGVGQGGGQGSGGNQGSFNRFANNFNRAAKGPLKFDEDYDFESANVKVKLACSSGGIPHPRVPNPHILHPSHHNPHVLHPRVPN